MVEATDRVFAIKADYSTIDGFLYWLEESIPDDMPLKEKVKLNCYIIHGSYNNLGLVASEISTIIDSETCPIVTFKKGDVGIGKKDRKDFMAKLTNEIIKERELVY